MTPTQQIRKVLYAITIRSRKVLSLRRANGSDDLRVYYRALELIERQLEASLAWSLQSHKYMVQALREEIIALQSLNHRAQYIRTMIADLLYKTSIQ